jgi:hypothetical protein
MKKEDVLDVLDDPLAQELLRSNIPAPLAYTAGASSGNRQRAATASAS